MKRKVRTPKSTTTVLRWTDKSGITRRILAQDLRQAGPDQYAPLRLDATYLVGPSVDLANLEQYGGDLVIEDRVLKQIGTCHGCVVAAIGIRVSAQDFTIWEYVQILSSKNPSGETPTPAVV